MSAVLLAIALLAPASAQEVSPAPASSSVSELDRAYQKEFAFLRAEKQGLRKRLDELEADRSRRLGDADRELDRLQGRLLGLSRDADRAEDLLSQAERAGDRATEGAELLQSTLTQAAQTLDRAELAPAEAEEGDPVATTAQAQALAGLFTAAAQDLSQSSRLQVVDGSFFGAEGAAVDGQVVELGHIARYGVSATESGALVPAGEGRLRIADGLGVGEAQALAGGSMPAVLGVHIYESLAKRVDEHEDKTLADTMKAGGLVGWVIVILGLIGALMAVARAGLLMVAGRGVEGLVARVSDKVRAGQLEPALSEAKGANSSAGRVLASLIEAWLDGSDRSREHLEGVGSEALLREAPGLERFQATLRVIAAVAPLLGLLGTVTGMIGTFELITEYGTGDPKMLSTGISQALVTTQLGLVVAIPMLLIGNVLKGRADQVMGSLETGALAVLNSVDPDAPQLVTAAPEIAAQERAGA